jgi:hypothetical protein
VPALLAAALLAALLVAAPLRAGSTAPTRIVHYRVFTPAGAVTGIHVARTLRGSCWVGSIGLPRPDAWRCSVGNEILDPCLESPRGEHVPLVCVSGRRGIALRLTKPLPAKERNAREKTFFAWRLVLPRGDVCERFTGTAAGVVQNQGLVYGCTSGGTTTEPSRRHATWTVRYLHKGVDPFTIKKLSQLELLPVVRALG